MSPTQDRALMSNAAARLRRAAAGMLVALLSLALLQACAGPTPSAVPPAANASGDEQRMYAAVLSGIRNVYLEEVPIQALALSGLKELAELESAVDVAVDQAGDAGDIRVLINGTTVATLAMPATDDVGAWATGLAALVSGATQASQPLRDSGRERIYQAVFDGMLRKLDRYSRYEDPETARRNRDSREGFGGVGVTIVPSPRGARIVRIQENSPAVGADLAPEDEIVAADGHSLTGLTLQEIVDILRGPPGTTVRLSVVRQDGGLPFPVDVMRRKIVPKSVFYRRDGNLAAIRMTGFNHETTQQLEAALQRARLEIGARLAGIVLDLRGNPGGYLDQAVDTADLFVANGRISATSGRHPDSMQLFDATRGQVGELMPVAILLNGASASAAEILAAALQDHGRAVVVGTTSFGKGTVQTLLHLPNEGELVLTWARLHAPSGYAFHERGVTPSICTSDVDAAAAFLRAMTSHAAAVPPPGPPLHAAPCPWRPREGPDLDFDIARELLVSPTLYQQALRAAPTGS